MLSPEEEDDDQCFLMGESDPKYTVTIESIVSNLIKSFFSENYGDKEYWDERYEESTEQYEWFQSWNTISPYIQEFITHGKALNIGCGNSPMSYDMLSSGFESILSTDISENVISQMKEKYKETKQLRWEVLDCTNMNVFEDNQFDFVIDKGTIDAIYCNNDSSQLITRTLNEIYRILKPGSYYIDISFGNPSSRKELTSCKSTNLMFIKSIEIPHPQHQDTHHYIYVLRKPN